MPSRRFFAWGGRAYVTILGLIPAGLAIMDAVSLFIRVKWAILLAILALLLAEEAIWGAISTLVRTGWARVRALTPTRCSHLGAYPGGMNDFGRHLGASLLGVAILGLIRAVWATCLMPYRRAFAWGA